MFITRRSLSLLLLLGVAFFAGCTRNYNYPELVAGDVVVALGDQFTAGTGASERFSYPDLLSKSTNAKVINMGRAGRGGWAAVAGRGVVADGRRCAGRGRGDRLVGAAPPAHARRRA